MDHEKFKKLLKDIKLGKKLPDAIYLHVDAFDEIPGALSKFTQIVANALKVSSWNVAKFSRKEFKLSLLYYPDFYEDSYPALEQAVTVDLKKLEHKVISYKDSENPPILHRKELFVPESHGMYGLFCEITKEGEDVGLYENTRIIGFKETWKNLIEKKGLTLINGRIAKSSGNGSTTTDDKVVDRHKTAIVRHELSAPMKLLAKNGFLNGDYSIFDFGCGRGDDLTELQAHGIDAVGYDPNFYPESEKVVSDIVNLGFVINVIEDRDERIDVVLQAWELTQKMLVVSVMLASESYISQFTAYKDGVITSRNTFQKYYTQSEIKGFLESVIGDNAVALAPGIFAIFKDKELEQTYQKHRYQRTYEWQQKTSPQLPTDAEKLRIVFAQNEELFKAFWLKCLVLGRCPANDEFSNSDEVRKLAGSHKKAFKLALDFYSEEEFKAAEMMKKEDLLLYFSMSLFDKHKPYTKQPEEVKRDVKAFFGDYKTAKSLATELLFEIADVDKIEAECIFANESLPASKLEHESGKPHSLTVHKTYIDALPLLLRVYVGAALQLYGDIEDIQLVKLHITSGKVTLLGYENFEKEEFPKLKERVKIKMAEQDIDFFDYINSSNINRLNDKSCYVEVER
ncbi:MAG: DNA phosphorothioation-associated putative methyltransferase [Gammaproteobacteria bacterium]|jgi:DNA phosphorothioation-associated putative methyltransferase|nr:DNA phosphorothioation-associated putative methyltransferase [Gammaproteobacteria bacterium]MEA3382777.1 DNA phosphorothioation-associated putative methyltransferase [Pseudomonadota bacterium]